MPVYRFEHDIGGWWRVRTLVAGLFWRTVYEGSREDAYEEYLRLTRR